MPYHWDPETGVGGHRHDGATKPKPPAKPKAPAKAKGKKA